MSITLNASEDDLKVFMEEADELLQLLDEDLVRLEQEPDSVGLLQEIFRAAHTLKGSSATIGHDPMARLTHAMESLLDKLRKGELSVSAEIISALLEALDALRILEGEIATLEESGVELDAIVEQLAQLTTRGRHKLEPLLEAVETCPAEYDSCLANTAMLGGQHLLDIYVHLDGSSSYPAARALQIVLALSEGCLIDSSQPSLDDITAEKVGSELYLLLATEWDKETVEKAILSVEDVLSVDISLHASDRIPPAIGTSGPSSVTIAAGASPDGTGKNGASQPSKMPSHIANYGAKTVRIEIERLDTLLNLVGELVIERTRLYQLGSSFELRYSDDMLVGQLVEASDRVGRITDQLQEQVMKSRMLPIDNVFSRLPRAVRDLAVRLDKKVNLVIEGQETELDRSVIEELSDPLLHLLRNAVDHGLETSDVRLAKEKPEVGIIRLTASHAENQVIITVSDDGGGIDPAKVRMSAVNKKLISQEAADKLSDKEAVKLIFAAGLSTAQEVSDISGRGVGMDVVRANIEKLNGSVEVASELDVGTTFVVRLPLTLAIIQALLVQIGDASFAIPMVSVTETLRIDEAEIQTIHSKEAVLYRGMVLPLLRVNHLFGGCAGTVVSRGHAFVVAVRAGNRQVGLIVDALLGEQDIVIKPLGTFLGDLAGVSGATIMGDGRVALIIDVLGLVNSVIEA